MGEEREKEGKGRDVEDGYKGREGKDLLHLQ